MTKCRVCNTKIHEFFSLGKMPLVNAFLKKEDLLNEKKFDLSVGFCPNCYLVQLIKTVNPKDLFSSYLYFSSVTKSVVDHSKRTSEYFIKKFGLNSKSHVLEIGSNDGVHLQFYKEKGIKVLGVDPARNIAKVANEKGVKTITEFFTLKLAKKLFSQGTRADLVYGANVFAHVPEIVDFVNGVKNVLNDNGTAVFEFPYVRGLLENKFDTIYHEHVFYYSIIALKNLFNTVNLQIYDVEYLEMQGGSLRIFVSKTLKFPISKRVKDLENEEIKKDYDRLVTYRKMNINVKKLKIDLLICLERLKKEGKKIAAYGAPAKGMVLLNFFGIKKYLDFIVDKSPAKQGLCTPGSHMYIYNPSRIRKNSPDYLLILPWNIAAEILMEYKWYKKLGGKFIIPVPVLQVL